MATTWIRATHFHNHIIINAFNLECTGKYRDPFYSGKYLIPKISDRLCKEYGLSVIEVKNDRRDTYNKWQYKKGTPRFLTQKERLEGYIQAALDKNPQTFDKLLEYLKDYDCVVNKRGKSYSVVIPYSKKPIRLSSLSDEFHEEALRKRIKEQQFKPQQHIEQVTTQANFNTDIAPPKPQHERDPKEQQFKPPQNIEQVATQNNFNANIAPPKPQYERSPNSVQLIIDVENSLKATESIGYKRWVDNFNIQQMPRTLLFIAKHNLNLEQLENMATQSPQKMENINNNIATINAELRYISMLQIHIGAYGKTKNIYAQYKKSSNPEGFRMKNAEAIAKHELAKAYFNESGYGFANGGRELPSIEQLKEKFATLDAERKGLWFEYQTLNIAKAN